MIASPQLGTTTYPAPSFSRPRGGQFVKFSFEVHSDHVSSLRSAIEEISNDIGGRLTGSHSFAKEDALTDAAIGLGILRAEICSKVSEGNPAYV